MNRSRWLTLAVAVVGSSVLLPGPARAQYSDGGRYAGFHLGMSGVGSTAAIGVQGEVAYKDRISIGAWIDTWSYGQTFTVLGARTDWDTRYIAIAGTGSYHFPIEDSPKLDPFVGASVGYYVVSVSTTGPSGATYTGDSNRLFWGGHVGARYFFKPNMSAVARAGVGASYLTLGMDFGL